MNFTDIANQFEKDHCPLLKQYTIDVVNFINYLLINAEIDFLSINSRVKDTDSFINKLKFKSYNNPFRDVKDLAGIRIITYYSDDVIKIADLISRYFIIESKHCEDKLNSLDVDEFGYRSFHLVCRITEDREKLPEWEKYSQRSIEIQVRTVLQHAWASISHKIDYKSLDTAPRELRRKLFRLSALFELADDQLLELRNESNIIAEDYKQRINKGEYDIPINLNSLFEFLKKKNIPEEWLIIAKETEMPEYKNDIYSDGSIHRLWITLHALNIKTIGDFEKLINKHKGQAIATINRIFREIINQGGRFSAVPNDLINIVIAKGECAKFEKQFRWPDFWSKEVCAVMNRTCQLEGPTRNI